MPSELEALVRDGRFEEALRAARDAWVESADPALVGLMDRLAVHVPRPPIAKQGRESHAAAWARRCADDDPADLDVLIDDLLGRHQPGCDGDAMRALALRTPDPRAALRIAAFLESRVGLSSSNRWFWLRGIWLVASTGEPTSCAALRRWQQAHAGRTKPWGQMVARELAKLEPTERPVRPMAGIAALAERIAAPAAEGRDLTALWADAWATPTDLAVRAVLADRLQEEGDPRGQLIALQLERGPHGKPGREERALLKQWERTWLGVIEPVVLRSGTQWEGGFLTACRYGNRPAKGDERTADEWRTVETIDVSAMVWVPSAFDLFDHAPFESLRDVWGIAAWDLDQLGSRSWRSLGLRSYPGQIERLVGAPGVLDGLPQLELLCVEDMEGLTHDHVRRLLAHPSVRRLDTLRVSARLVEGLAALVQPGTALQVRVVAWVGELRWTEAGLELGIRSRGRRAGSPQQALESLVRRVGPLARVVVHDTAPVALDPGSLERAAEAAGAELVLAG
ncbi:MAG: hypothetical protein H6737_12625 [Alphaproteobacteria bacterium]|nr:hypothetical protein [Alphaproteobacteria bacterium]